MDDFDFRDAPRVPKRRKSKIFWKIQGLIAALLAMSGGGCLAYAAVDRHAAYQILAYGLIAFIIGFFWFVIVRLILWISTD